MNETLDFPVAYVRSMLLL